MYFRASIQVAIMLSAVVSVSINGTVESVNFKRTKRITFNEITKSDVSKAIENPRALDVNLVNAQQARRVLDRLVGYKISPLLWDKVKRGISAGRVQSVAIRLIVDREAEVKAFQPEEAPYD